MREALLKLVRMALRDGYLSDDLLELLDITETNMKKYSEDKQGGGQTRRYPQSGHNYPTYPG